MSCNNLFGDVDSNGEEEIMASFNLVCRYSPQDIEKGEENPSRYIRRSTDIRNWHLMNSIQKSYSFGQLTHSCVNKNFAVLPTASSNLAVSELLRCATNVALQRKTDPSPR
jgi:hypothetical protein